MMTRIIDKIFITLPGRKDCDQFKACETADGIAVKMIGTDMTFGPEVGTLRLRPDHPMLQRLQEAGYMCKTFE